MVIDDVKATMEYIERVTKYLGNELTKTDYYIEDLGCPHTKPKKLPEGYAAVYIFAFEQGDSYEYLKIGKANPKSSARLVYQHYGFGAPSTLAKSICSDADFKSLGINENNVAEWMFKNLHRVNVYLKVNSDTAISELVEAVFHYKFHPRFEGNI